MAGPTQSEPTEYGDVVNELSSNLDYWINKIKPHIKISKHYENRDEERTNIDQKAANENANIFELADELAAYAELENYFVIVRKNILINFLGFFDKNSSYEAIEPAIAKTLMPGLKNLKNAIKLLSVAFAAINGEQMPDGNSSMAFAKELVVSIDYPELLEKHSSVVAYTCYLINTIINNPGEFWAQNKKILCLLELVGYWYRHDFQKKLEQYLTSEQNIEKINREIFEPILMRVLTERDLKVDNEIVYKSMKIIFNSLIVRNSTLLNLSKAKFDRHNEKLINNLLQFYIVFLKKITGKEDSNEKLQKHLIAMHESIEKIDPKTILLPPNNLLAFSQCGQQIPYSFLIIKELTELLTALPDVLEYHSCPSEKILKTIYQKLKHILLQNMMSAKLTTKEDNLLNDDSIFPLIVKALFLKTHSISAASVNITKIRKWLDIFERSIYLHTNSVHLHAKIHASMLQSKDTITAIDKDSNIDFLQPCLNNLHLAILNKHFPNNSTFHTLLKHNIFEDSKLILIRESGWQLLNQHNNKFNKATDLKRAIFQYAFATLTSFNNLSKDTNARTCIRAIKLHLKKANLFFKRESQQSIIPKNDVKDILHLLNDLKLNYLFHSKRVALDFIDSEIRIVNEKLNSIPVKFCSMFPCSTYEPDLQAHKTFVIQLKTKLLNIKTLGDLEEITSEKKVESLFKNPSLTNNYKAINEWLIISKLISQAEEINNEILSPSAHKFRSSFRKTALRSKPGTMIPSQLKFDFPTKITVSA